MVAAVWLRRYRRTRQLDIVDPGQDVVGMAAADIAVDAVVVIEV